MGIAKGAFSVPANKLEDHFLLLHEDWRINIDAHVSGSACYDSHSGLDGFAVQVWQLLLSNYTHLLHCYFSNLLALWLL